ncbi:MAG: ATP-binding cassette domain-containing protein [Acidimicrobiia bacterium]|nr:ATP-binding cassette domain-containing protein [Acidimicrobiia bacterium]
MSFDAVSKWFGDVVAVSEVSFQLWPGVTALLGPNGAGKSTVLRMLAGLTSPSRGTVRVLGRDPRADVDVTRDIGLAPQQEALFEQLSALAFVRLAAALHQLPDPEGAATRALDVVELDAGDRRRVGSYSKGMRQRVKLAQAIVHDPHLVVLDEPLTGLDPRQRLAMIEVVGRLGQGGRCVIVSSHVLDEVERFGSRILVIAQGRLAAEGDFHAIRNLMDDRPRRFAVRVERAREVAAELVRWGLAVGVQLGETEDQLVVQSAEPASFRRWIAPLARHLGCRLWEVNPLDEDLESVFRYVVEGR